MLRQPTCRDCDCGAESVDSVGAKKSPTLMVPGSTVNPILIAVGSFKVAFDEPPGVQQCARELVERVDFADTIGITDSLHTIGGVELESRVEESVAVEVNHLFDATVSHQDIGGIAVRGIPVPSVL